MFLSCSIRMTWRVSDGDDIGFIPFHIIDLEGANGPSSEGSQFREWYFHFMKEHCLFVHMYTYFYEVTHFADDVQVINLPSVISLRHTETVLKCWGKKRKHQSLIWKQSPTSHFVLLGKMVLLEISTLHFPPSEAISYVLTLLLALATTKESAIWKESILLWDRVALHSPLEHDWCLYEITYSTIFLSEYPLLLNGLLLSTAMSGNLGLC